MQITRSGKKNIDICDSDNQKYCNTLSSMIAQHVHVRLYIFRRLGILYNFF